MSKQATIPELLFPTWWKNWLSKLIHLPVPWWGDCFALWLTVLLILSGVGLWGTRVLEPGEGIPPNLGVAADSIPGIWARWDSSYYLTVATNGYQNALEEHTLGFFPLYPLLINGLAHLSHLKPAVAGMVIAQFSYLVAILLFYKVARLIRDDHQYAMRCTLFLVLFPTSFFYLAIYAESLYLALAILTVYLLLRPRPRFILSGITCGLASLARPVGWLFNLVTLVEWSRGRLFRWRTLLIVGVALSLSVVGVVLYVIYAYTLTGSWLAIPETQALWQRQWQLPWQTYGQSIAYALWGNGIANDWFLYAINWVDLCFTTLAIGLTIAAAWQAYRHKSFPWSLVVYLTISILFLLAQRGPDVVPLWGMARWVGALFPLYLVLGNTIHNKTIQVLSLLASGGLLIVATLWWTSGRWVS